MEHSDLLNATGRTLICNVLIYDEEDLDPSYTTFRFSCATFRTLHATFKTIDYRPTYCRDALATNTSSSHLQYCEQSLAIFRTLRDKTET